MYYLSEQLKKYQQKDYYPFHMPGHKRNPFSVEYMPSIETDITEIDGFDNLHHAEGILLDAERRASDLYRSRETLYSINGSTGALLSAISACTSVGGKILMARNCHKAAYHAVYIRQLKPVYLYPEWEESFGLNGGISPKEVADLLRRERGVQAVLITSPTYDGVVSDVESIAEICHAADIPLIVDEAHGAHFPFHEVFPAPALSKGADIVVQSLHKTLPAMTQTALLHRGSDRVSSELLHRYMGIYQSSSPSYPLMASMDSCICRLMKSADKDFGVFVKYLLELYEDLKGCRSIRMVTKEIVHSAEIYDWDISRIILASESATGKELYKYFLHEHHLQMEMDTPAYVLGIATVADTREGFCRLREAVLAIDEKLSRREQNPLQRGKWKNGWTNLRFHERIALHAAMDAPRRQISLQEASGCSSGNFISLYPPGIPLIVPGECITEEFISYLEQCLEEGFAVHGLDEAGRIGVVYE